VYKGVNDPANTSSGEARLAVNTATISPEICQ